MTGLWADSAVNRLRNRDCLWLSVGEGLVGGLTALSIHREDLTVFSCLDSGHKLTIRYLEVVFGISECRVIGTK